VKEQDGRIDAVIREFARLLDVLGGQLTDATREAGSECASLGDVLGRVAAAASQIESSARGTTLESVVRAPCADVTAALHTAVVTLQYEDRLAQRIGHIRAGLTDLHGLLRDYPLRSHEVWMGLLQDVDLIQALRQQQLSVAPPDHHDNAELF
jgi:hypothetical protein